MTLTKDVIYQAVDDLPQESWEDLWLVIEFLKFKSLSSEKHLEKPIADPEGAFPELDLSYEAIEASLQVTWRDRSTRLSI